MATAIARTEGRGYCFTWLMQMAADRHPKAFQLSPETQARLDAWRLKQASKKS